MEGAGRYTPGHREGSSANCQTKQASQGNSESKAKQLTYLNMNPLIHLMKTEFALEIFTAVWKGECCLQGQIHSLTPSLSISLMLGQRSSPHGEESCPQGTEATVEQSRGGRFIKLNVLVGGCSLRVFHFFFIFLFFPPQMNLPSQRIGRTAALVWQNSNWTLYLCSFFKVNFQNQVVSSFRSDYSRFITTIVQCGSMF